MSTGQIELALELADSKLKRRRDSDYRMLWELRDIIGWPGSLGGKCTDAWQYLSEGAKRWKWLAPIFGSSHKYQACLAAYYMALNVHELAWYLARVPEADSRLRVKADLHVPLCFMQEPQVTLDSAFRLLIRQQTSVPAIWNTVGVSRIAMENHWSAWLTVCQEWLANVYPFRLSGRGNVGHADLFSVLS